MRLLVLTALVGGFCLTGCSSSGPYGKPGTVLERKGDEIMVAGTLVHTGAPVVLWTDPGGYDAYRAESRFIDQQLPTNPVSDAPIRYGSWRRHIPEDVRKAIRAEGWSLARLQEYVDQFVIHYDVCGTSRRCFQVLQDMRGLSVHFMLDLDGTIYQTLDAKERAWHAGSANDRSVGIEIANMGAYGNMKTLDEWYGQDEHGTRVTFPDWLGPTGIRTPNFVARPARDVPVVGEINGRVLRQYDLTDEQYDSLIKLTAALSKALPKIKPDYPRDENGELIRRVLTAEEMANHSGLIAHWHITRGKVDPGPAFDWDRVLAGVERELR